jgi:hypothetical protein
MTTRLLVVKTMKEFPGGIPQVEERRAVLLHEEPLVRADLQSWQPLASERVGDT